MTSFFLSTAFLLFTLLTPAFAQHTLFIGSAFEPPISKLDQKGIVDSVVREAFARIGKEAFVTPLPAQRSLLNADQGVNDGDLIRIAGMQKHFPNLIQVPEKLIDFEFVAFSKDSSLRINDWMDMCSFSVGIVRGWKILEQKGSCALLTRVDSLDLLFILLEKGRADLVIYEKLAGLQAIQELKLTGIQQIEPPLEVQPMYLYLHKKHKKLAKPLAATLKAMKRDGSYQRIIAKGKEHLSRGGFVWAD